MSIATVGGRVTQGAVTDDYRDDAQGSASVAGGQDAHSDDAQGSVSVAGGQDAHSDCRR